MSEKHVKMKPAPTPKTPSVKGDSKIKVKSKEAIVSNVKDAKTVMKDVLVKKAVESKLGTDAQERQPQKADSEATESVENATYVTADNAYHKGKTYTQNREWIDYLNVDELGELVLPDYVSETFDKFLDKHKLRDIRYHDLRHTSASLLLNKGKGHGITLKDVQIWLGHSDFATTANIYAHLDATSKMISMNVMTGLVTA